MLFELVDNSRIAAISRSSRFSNASPFAERAAGLPSVAAEAEAVVGLDADLILLGANTSKDAEHLLSQLGVPLLRFEEANSFEVYTKNLKRLAAALHAEPKARQLVAQLRQWQQETHSQLPPQAQPIPALVIQANTYSPGRSSLVNYLIELAGLSNALFERGDVYGQFVPIEQIVSSPAPVLVLSERELSTPSQAELLLQHPALTAGARANKRLTITIPDQWWTCAGLYSVQAVTLIRSALKAHTELL